MPRKVLINKIGFKEKLTESQEMHLVNGHCLSERVRWHNRLDFPFRDEEHRKALWFKHREFLMGAVGSTERGAWKTVNYGERPHAWWSYEAPAMREVVQGSSSALCGRISKGRLCGISGVPAPVIANYPVYEDEFDFLKRHDLLLADEEANMLEAERREDEDLKRRGLKRTERGVVLAGST